MTVEQKYYQPTEEKINVVSHFIGIILSLLFAPLLIIKGVKSASVLHVVSYCVFAVSVFLLFLASTLYHSAKVPHKRAKLKIFDHAAIYVLIAGTYTPFSLLVLRGAWGWSIFGVVWFIAFAGLILKLFFTGRFTLLSTISYVAMGWVVVIAIKPLIDNFCLQGLLLLLAGGIFYTVGAVLYSLKKIPMNHAIFHLFVLAGCISHYLAIFLYT